MLLTSDKIDKLVTISRLYYEEGRTQKEIAQRMGISRPLVSRYLTEAREHGIVKIQIQSPVAERKVILDGLQQKFGLRGGLVADSQPNEADTNRAVADALIERLTEVEGMTVGIGWGPMISTVVRRADQMLPGRLNTRVYPLAGSRGILSQDYRMDEILTTFAKSTGGQAFCWDAPAFAEDPEDMERLKDTDAYRQMERGWKAAKIAFVDIENYPSVPDFATAARYGSRLAEEKAVGKILSYYYDIHGRFIKPEVYCSMQIPREILSKRKFVVGLCSAGVNSRALYGALKTGIFTHIAASKDILKEILDLSE